MLNVVTRTAFEVGREVRVDGKVGRIVEVDTIAFKVEFEIPGLRDEAGQPTVAFEWVEWRDVLNAFSTPA